MKSCAVTYFDVHSTSFRTPKAIQSWWTRVFTGLWTMLMVREQQGLKNSLYHINNWFRRGRMDLCVSLCSNDSTWAWRKWGAREAVPVTPQSWMQCTSTTSPRWWWSLSQSLDPHTARLSSPCSRWESRQLTLMNSCFSTFLDQEAGEPMRSRLCRGDISASGKTAQVWKALQGPVGYTAVFDWLRWL